MKQVHRLTFVALTVTGLGLWARPVHAQTLASAAQTPRTYLDQTTLDHCVKPGDDFYTYANGAWLKANEIPASEASWGNWSILQKQTRLQLQELLQEVAAQPHQPGSDAHKLQALYNSGMNTAALDKLGVQPLQADLARIDAAEQVVTAAPRAQVQDAVELQQAADEERRKAAVLADLAEAERSSRG